MARCLSRVPVLLLVACLSVRHFCLGAGRLYRGDSRNRQRFLRPPRLSTLLSRWSIMPRAFATLSPAIPRDNLCLSCCRPESTPRAPSLPDMSPQLTPKLHVDVGATTELDFKLQVGGAKEMVTVSGEPPMVETQSNAVSSLVDKRAIEELPLDGRRFTDLALLTPGVTQDPRGLTSGSNGDLAFGGIRGYQSSYLGRRGDNNNAFFAQARGRYRAPYQFSERSGGGVPGLVEYLRRGTGTSRRRGDQRGHEIRDRTSCMEPIFISFETARSARPSPSSISSHTLSNSNSASPWAVPFTATASFFFGGLDQHIFHVPTVVRFLDGSSTSCPASRPGTVARWRLRSQRSGSGVRRCRPAVHARG